jgi:hypothetical protein
VREALDALTEEFVTVVSRPTYSEREREAEKLIRDPDDVPVAALALAVDNRGIWTFTTRDFSRPALLARVRVLGTAEVKALFSGEQADEIRIRNDVHTGANPRTVIAMSKTSRRLIEARALPSSARKAGTTAFPGRYAPLRVSGQARLRCLPRRTGLIKSGGLGTEISASLPEDPSTPCPFDKLKDPLCLIRVVVDRHSKARFQSGPGTLLDPLSLPSVSSLTRSCSSRWLRSPLIRIMSLFFIRIK